MVEKIVKAVHEYCGHLDNYGNNLVYFLLRKHTKLTNGQIFKKIDIVPDEALMSQKRFKTDFETIEVNYLYPSFL